MVMMSFPGKAIAPKKIKLEVTLSSMRESKTLINIRGNTDENSYVCGFIPFID